MCVFSVQLLEKGWIGLGLIMLVKQLYLTDDRKHYMQLHLRVQDLKGFLHVEVDEGG